MNQKRIKKNRLKKNDKAPVQNMRGSWSSQDDRTYTVLANWSEDAGAFDDDDAEEKAALEESWRDTPVEAQQARANALKTALRRAWAQGRAGAVASLLGTHEPSLAQGAKQEFMEETLAEMTKIIAAKGWGDQARHLVGAIEGWGYYQLHHLGQGWERVAILLARWHLAALAAAKAGGALATETAAVKEASENSMSYAIQWGWTQDEAERVKDLILSLGEGPEWERLWARVVREKIGRGRHVNTNLARAFGVLRPEDLRHERNQRLEGSHDSEDLVQIEIAFEYGKTAPLKIARKIFRNLIIQSKQNGPAMALRANAARPGWVHPKQAAEILWSWLGYHENWSESSMWGKWREKNGRAIAQALKEGCPRPIDWSAPAVEGLHAPWGASLIENKSGQRAGIGFSAQGPRLSLAQAFWIQGNKPAIAWLAEQGVHFTVDDARDLLDIFGNNGMPLEFSGPMSQPLKQMVAEHEARELQAVAMANRRSAGEEGTEDSGGASRRGRGRRI